jgi:hypothetical protein
VIAHRPRGRQSVAPSSDDVLPGGHSRKRIASIALVLAVLAR